MKTTPISTPHAGLRAGKPAILAMALLLSCLAGMGARRADAAGYTWDAVTPSGTITDGTGTWNTTNANWFASGTTTQWVNGSDAQFGITGNAPAGSATTLTLGTNITVADLFVSNDGKLGQVTINSVAGSGTLTISGSVSSGDGNGTLITGPVFITNATGLVDASSVTIGGVATPGNGSTITMSGSVNVGGSGAVTVATNGNGGLTLSGTVAGATSLNVSNGTLTLSGTVLQDNTINVTGGTLLLSGTNAALGGAATISISNGTLDLSNANAVFASNYAATISQSGGTLKLKPGNVPTLTGTWGMTGGSLLISGSIFTGTIGTGANQLDISAGTLGVSATGTYSFNVGGTSAGGMLVWGSTAGFNLGTSAFNLESADNTMTFANSIDFNGGTRTIQDNAPNNNGSLLILGGTLQNSGTGNLVIQDSVNRNQGDTWVDLTGANTYTGTTFISGSTGNNNPMRIILGSSGSYSSASYDITGTTGGQLQIMPGNSGTTYVSGNIITPTGTDNTALHFTNDAGYTVVIGGTGTVNSLVSSGAGVTVLTGANTYTGSTLIKSGTLQIGNGGAAGSLPAATGINSLANTALVYDVSSTGTLTGTLTGSMSFTQEGSGLIALANAETYTGPTNITSGTLQLGNGTTDGSLTSGTINNAGTLVFNTNGSQNYAGQLSGNGTVTMSGSGNQKLSGANNYTGPTNVNAGTLQLGSTTALGSTSTLTVSGSATLNLSNGVSTQITTMSGTGQSLVLNNGAVLNFGVGNATADQLNLSGTTTVTGTTYIDLGLVSGTGVSNFTIISDSNPFVLNGGTFVLGTLPSLTSGSLTVTGSTVSVTYSGVSTVYWEGNGTGTAGSWSDYTNFTSNPAATGTLNAQFGSAQAVVFSATNAGESHEGSSLVNYNATIKSLTINDPNAVKISSTTSNSLTLATSGITTGSGAGVATIGTPGSNSLTVALSGTPNITVNNAAGLTIGAVISGSNGILVNGSTGVLTLAGVNTYTGSNALDSGTVAISTDSNLGNAANAVTFNGGTANATLQSLTNGLTSSRAFVFSSGTGTIDPGPAGNVMTLSGSVSGTGAFNEIDTGQLVLSGSDLYTGTATVSSGTMTITNIASLASAGASTYITQAGATLQLAPTAAVDWEPSNTITFSGSGRLVFIPKPNTDFQVHASNVNLTGTGGTIEIASGTLQNGGPSGSGSIIWTNNKDSLQIDAGAVFDVWDGASPLVDALTGSGTITRLGYGDNLNTVTIGDNNGSGTFAGSIINQWGTISIVKEGTGTEVFTGTNGYAGSTTVNGGGTLRITNGTALGFGGQTFISQTGQHTASVSGGAALDVTGGTTLNEAITLNGGSLTNSGTGTSILDSGIAGITFNNDNTTTATGTNSIAVAFTGGSGSNAAAMAGTQATVESGNNSNGNNLYTQMTSAGSGYTPGNAPTVTLGGGSFGGTVTAVVSSLTLSGTGDTLGGNGNLIINAQISGTGGFTTTGTGTVVLTGSEIYTSVTNVATGNLAVNGYLSGPGALNLTSSVATLSGTGAIAGAVSVTTGATIAPGSNTSGNFGSSGTLTLNGGLTLANGVNLDYDLGSTQDLIAVNGQLTLGSGIVLTISPTSALAAGTPYTLITYTGALSGSTTGWTLAGGSPGITGSFSSAGGVVTVTLTATGAPGNAYWGGAYGSGGSGTWNTFANGASDNTNWLSAQNSGSDTHQLPYGTTNVYFIADSGSNLNTVLGAATNINSLNFTGTDAAVTTGSAVTISGSVTGSGINNTLTINATGTNGNIVGSGLTTGLGAGADTINASIVLGGNQTWTLNASPAAPLTVTGTISGSHALTVAGIGELVLGGNNTFTNGLTIDNSATVVLGNAGALNSTSPDSVTFGPSSTGTLSLNGNSVTIGSLSTNATPGAPVINNGNATPATLMVDQAASGTYAGAIQDGVGGGSLSLAMAGPGVLTLTGSNSYTGVTNVNGGELLVNGYLTSGSNVTINATGTLGGSGGTIGGLVITGSGGKITSTVGTSNPPGTLMLGSGLAINSGGIAAFNVVNGGANDEIVITGSLTLSSGAILQVPQLLTTSGTYDLMTYTGGISNPSLAGITEETLTGGALASNYSFTTNSGTLELIVTQSLQSIAAITITSPASGQRVIANTAVTVSGAVSNPGVGNALSGTLSNAGLNLAVGNFNPMVASVTAGGSTGYSGTIASTGSSLGNNTFGVTVTDGSSLNTSATASGTIDVLQNRTVTAGGVPTYGVVHEGTVVSSTFTLTSAGADNQNTRVTVANSGTDAFGIAITGGTNPVFNGSTSDTRVISGTFTSAGTDNGITLVTSSAETGGSLPGEVDINVPVNFNAIVFSGHATWSGNGGNGVWSTNNNWGDINSGVIGAPGLSGPLSIGDTATFTDGPHEVIGGTTTVNLNGVNPSLAALTFSASNTIYNIASGTASGTLAMQTGGTISVTTGTGVISANLTGTGALTVTVAPGSDLIWSGSNTFTGSASITSGTFTISNPVWLGQTTGTNVYNIASGAVLQLNDTSSENVMPVAGAGITFTGSGTLEKTGSGTMQFHNGNAPINMNMTGGVVEIAGGLFQDGGNGNNGHISWVNNLASLQIDSGAAFDLFDGSIVYVDALLGSGTLTRSGYSTGNGNPQGLVIGVNNGSGTFAGVITNAFGQVNLIKEGTGVQVLSGSNSYSGSTAVTGGTLRITNGGGLGFGNQTFVTQGGQHTTYVTGAGSTLDVNGGITVNTALTLNNGGGLINGAAGTTSVFDSGIAGITFTSDNATGATGTNSLTVTFGSGSAQAIAGTVGGFAGGSADNLYVQMTSAGSGYTPGAAPTVAIQGGVGGTVTAVVSSIALTGTGDTLGGSGDLLINAQITGTGGFTTVGTGTVTLANLETYTGPTTLAAGTTLQLGTGYSYAGSIGGPGSIIVASTGPAILAGINTYTGLTTINAGSTLQLGNGTTDGAITSSTVRNNGALVFDTMGFENLPSVLTGTGTVTMSGVGTQEISGANTYTGATVVNSGTLQFGSTTASGSTPHITVGSSGAVAFSNGSTPQTTNLAISGQTLTLNNGATLVFGVSSSGTADQLVISNGAVLSLNGVTYIDPALLSGTGGAGPYLIITDASGFQGSGSFALGPLPALATGTLTQTGTSVSISYTAISTIYWAGSGTGMTGYGSWADYSDFTSDITGTVPISGTFGPTQDVVFSASNAINQTMGANYLDTNVTMHSLTINDPAGGSGVDIGQLGNYTLTIVGATGHTGITVGSPAGSPLAEIDANIDFTGTSNITVDNTGGLLITGAISGNNGLLVNGTGLLTLEGNDAGLTGNVQLVSGTLNIEADNNLGAGGAGNVVTFNPGAGNSVTLQSANPGLTINHNVVFSSGTGIIDPGAAGSVVTIAGLVSGNGTLQLIDTGELVLSGSMTGFNGTALVSSGVLSITFPGTLAQSGTAILSTAPGATVVLSDVNFQNIVLPSAADGLAFTGSGTVQIVGGPADVQLHGNTIPTTSYVTTQGGIYMDMNGGTIDVEQGMLENGGLGNTNATPGNPTAGTGSPLWTGSFNGVAFTNLASLEIDASGTFDTWNGNNVMVDALNGAGVLTRLGYLNAEVGSTVTIGDNNGSGEFDGTITNAIGNLSLIKTGTGTEIFTGNNSYSGSTLINGGVLRVTSNTALGNGGPVYFTGTNPLFAANGTVTVTGSAKLDLYGGVTVDKAIVLNGGRVINADAGTTSILDNGVAAVALGGTQVGTYGTPTLTATNDSNGSAAFGAGSGTTPAIAPNTPVVNVFGEVVTPGTGYTVAPTLVYYDNSGTGSGVTATAILSSLTLQGTNNYLGGNGNLTINAQISGAGGGFNTAGTGTLTLNGSNSYTGATIVNAGSLVNNGYITGVVNVNPSASAAATLGGTGTFGGLVSTSGTSGLNIPHLAPGVNTSGNFGAAGTLTFKNGLTIGNGTNLDYDLGTSSDLMAVTGALTLGSGDTLNINKFTGFTQGTYTLISDTGGSISGNTSSWSVTGLTGDNYVLASSGSGVTITITPVTNDSQLSIAPGTISLGSVLVGFTPATTTGTLTNTDSGSNGSSAVYTAMATGSASVLPASGTVSANSTQVLTVGASGTIGGPSGNNIQIGTVSASDSSNVSGSAAPVAVTANVFQQYSGTTPSSTTGSGSAALTLTNLASTDAGGQRAGVTVTGFGVNNSNFLVSQVGGGVVGTANGSNVTATVGEVTTGTNLLDGTYTYSGAVTGTAQYSDPALALQSTVSNQTWNNVSVTATITGNSSNARTNVFSAQVMSGSSYAGYSLSSSVIASTHMSTGTAGNSPTTATLLAGTAGALTTVSMSFDSTTVTGPDNTFRTSDILTLTGINSAGVAQTRPDGVLLTDEFVLQLSYDNAATGLEFIGQNSGHGWVNTISYNANNYGNTASQFGMYAPLNESYAQYVANNPSLTFSQQLGAYGYSNGVAWAVLDHTAVNDPISEFAVIPEPGTYAMIFSGFGMLIGFRRLRRRRSQDK